MKKNQLIKFFVFFVFCISIIFISNYVNADDNTTQINDITNLIKNTNSSSSNTDNSNSSNTNSANTNDANTNTGNTNTNTGSGNISNSLPTTNNTSNTNSTNGTNTNNSSNYNNTNLPHTGIMDSTGTVVFLVIIFIVSALYAYKKINDYNGL